MTLLMNYRSMMFDMEGLVTLVALLSNLEMNEDVQSLIILYLPCFSSWLDCGAIINVDAPVCGMSVVRGPMGHK